DTNLPPLDARHETVSCSTSMPAAASSLGISPSRPAVAGPIAVISNVPGNWNPCSGLSDLISIARLWVRPAPNPSRARRVGRFAPLFPYSPPWPRPGDDNRYRERLRMDIRSTGLALGIACALIGATATAQAATAQQERAQKTGEIPVCSRSLGTLAVIESQGTNWWTGQRLASPTALIKVFVNRSRCFTLVDRGVGLKAMQAERGLAAGGDLRGGSNIGKGQIRAADYVMVPDVVSQNSNASGNRIGGLLGGLIGDRTAAAVIGGIDIKRRTADVVLTVTDARSSEQ